MNTLTFKTCSKCGEVKPVTEFMRNNRKKGGRRSECAECTKKTAKKYYDAHREEILLGKKRMAKKCPHDCFECPFDDCIA